MTEIVTRMFDILHRTGLYRGADAQLQAELQAYAAGLQLLEQAVQQLHRNRFVSTADSHGLDRWEKLFRRFPTEDTVEKRREMLLSRYGEPAERCTREALNQQLLACGIFGNLVEQYFGGLYVNVLQRWGVTPEEAQAEALRFLPAHLPVTFDFGARTWERLEQEEKTFSQLDAAEQTWAQLDRL